MRVYRGEGLNYKKLYVQTEKKRCPKKGEFFLSGAIPFAYKAPNDLSQAYYIARLAREDEITCKCCGQKLEINIVKD